MNKLVKTYASATLTVRIHNCGVFGTECGLEQVRTQAKEEARAILKRGLGRYVEVIDEPKITAVIVEEM
jgi:hypothetical protein